MKRISMLGAAPTVGVLTAMLALGSLTPMLPEGPVGHFLFRGFAIAQGRNQGWDILRSQTTGYYEQLMNRAAQRWGGRTLIERILDPWGKKPRVEPYVRGGFLRYSPPADLTWLSSDDPIELHANSLGLFDREYTTEKPPGTRRVAWIGDSISRGFSVELANRFETKLEERLNDGVDESTGNNLEILNFSVDGYRNTQLFYVAMEKAPAFHPDVYVVALTQLSVAPNWGSHLAQLVHDGEDVRFDFLRRVVTESRLQPGDDAALVEAKLARYRLPVLREILGRVQSAAHQQGAELIVVLVPAAEDPDTISFCFRGVHALIETLGITVVDLLDTYDSNRDVEALRLKWYDVHPNSRANELIADNLYEKLRQQPEAWAALMGSAEAGDEAP